MTNSKTDSTLIKEDPRAPLPPPSAEMVIARRVTMIGYLGLIILIPFWNLIWFPSATVNNLGLTLFWLFPLVFPMVGLIKGKAYTHAWSGFIAVIYICHALTCLITNPLEIIPVTLELILASMFLFGGMFFAKWRGEQLGLQLPKLKQNKNRDQN